jgi:pre-mRNA-splicing factor ISY1
MFRHQGPEYYGDVDEMDAKLAQEEDELARRGESGGAVRSQVSSAATSGGMSGLN